MAATGPELVKSGDDDPSASSPFPPSEPANTVIEYSANVIDHIRADTVAALLSIPYGGVEIAGVLYGRRTGRTAYVAARRLIKCEHASGPSFALSEKDSQQLERLLFDSQSDTDLYGLEVLGWYVSHTRRPFSLVPGDIEIFDRFFRGPGQITGIVQPSASGKARFGWFIRNEDGSVDAQRPDSEFTIFPTPGAPNPVAAPPAAETTDDTVAVAPRGGPRRGLRPGAFRPIPFQPFSNTLALARPVRRIRLSNRVIVGAGLLTLLAACAVFVFLQISPEGVNPAPLHVLDTGTQLRIDWNPKLPVVENARSGALEIKEPSGAPVHINLSQDMLRSGSVFYDKPASKVEVHLKLTGDKGQVSESMVYFIGREPEPKPVDPVVSAVVSATVEPAPPPSPAKVPPAFPDRGSAERARPAPAHSRAFQPPVVSKTSAGAETTLVEPPKISIPQSQTNLPLEASLRTSPPLAVPPAVVNSTAPAAAPQPTSGRLIWTGELHKGSVLQLTERGPSSGSLNGKLPARPIKVSVHSAELLDGVIAVYTPDANSLRTAETPGRRNGWNVTMYKYDPKRVHDLSLVETPAEGNNFKLGIKSNSRSVSIIVIDWRATN